MEIKSSKIEYLRMKIGRYVFALGMRDVSDCLGMLRQLDIYTARDGRDDFEPVERAGSGWRIVGIWV